MKVYLPGSLEVVGLIELNFEDEIREEVVE
jgi:hypothetical protein